MKSVRITAFFTVLLLVCGCSPYRDVAKFDLGDGFVCEVKMKDLPEPADPYYYTIKRSSAVTIPLSYITAYSEGEDQAFSIISSDDRRFVGLVTRERPSEVLMLFDKQTTATWPRAENRDLPAEVALRGSRLLESLTEGSKRRGLKLGQR